MSDYPLALVEFFSPLSHEGREGLSFLTGVLRLASACGRLGLPSAVGVFCDSLSVSISSVQWIPRRMRQASSTSRRRRAIRTQGALHITQSPFFYR